MLENLAAKLSNQMIKEAIITEGDQEVYAYGLECLLSSISQFTVIFLIAYIGGFLPLAFAYSIGFCLLKRSVGGYHANSRAGCMLISIVMVIVASWIPTLLTAIQIGFLAPVNLMIAGLIIYIKGPVSHPNNPRNAEQLKRNKQKSMWIIGFFLAVVLFGYYLIPAVYHHLLFVGSIGSLAAVLTIFVPVEVENET